MNTENIISFLIREKNYDKIQTERLSSKIDNLPDDIKASLIKWIENDEMTSPEYNGYTVNRILQAKPELTVLAAYLALDWVRKDPNTAIKAILTPVMKYTPKE